jgi:hypothetical protein
VTEAEFVAAVVVIQNMLFSLQSHDVDWFKGPPSYDDRSGQ